MSLHQDRMVAQVVVEKENNGQVMLWLEAEQGSITSPMQVYDNEDASGGQFIEVSPGNNNTKSAPVDGHVNYNFTVKNAGIYKVWGRVIASMHDEDAFWVKMDNGNWIRWKDIAIGCDWHWDEVHDNGNSDQVMEYNLEAGPHTLIFAYCLDQTRLDKLLITNDPDYIPKETGPEAKALFNAGSSTPVVNEKVVFDGSESFSTEGNIISYEWEFGDESKASGSMANHTYNAAGDYQVKLIVTDDKDLTSRLTKTITVYNDEPVVRFIYFPDRSKSGEVVTFDASTSFHPDGDIVNYAWNFGDGAIGKGAVQKHTYNSVGEYSVTLTVTDRQGKSKSETRLVTVITNVPKKVIYETDMCLDVDDVGALAVLHAMANNGEAEILAVCFNEVHPSGTAAIDAINTWYGRGDIPVGSYKDPLSNPDYSEYLDALTKFPHDLNNESAPSALNTYRQVLAAQPDSSVTIISVGFLNNLNDLLKKEPDLIAQKVKELVIMAGVNNDGFNLVRHNLVSATENIIRNWPTPIVISQPGYRILTGQGLKDSPEANPVREAYYKFFNSNFCGRPSWDPVAVLYGVRGVSDYFSKNTTGTGSLRNGFKWQMKSGHRSFLEALLPVESYARIIEDLMLVAPVK